MLIRLRSDTDAPLFQQIAGQLRRAIHEGRVQPGERLPTARELGESLQVNMHTVLRAYDELKRDGLLEVRRGRGVVVVTEDVGRAKLLDLAGALRTEATRQGMTLKELKRLLGQV